VRERKREILSLLEANRNQPLRYQQICFLSNRERERVEPVGTGRLSASEPLDSLSFWRACVQRPNPRIWCSLEF
jgi:hypothetical protein